MCTHNQPILSSNYSDYHIVQEKGSNNDAVVLYFEWYHLLSLNLSIANKFPLLVTDGAGSNPQEEHHVKQQDCSVKAMLLTRVLYV